jgi:uncharacterized protein YoxC
VIEPLFWLGLSIVLLAMSLTALLVASIPVLLGLARLAQSAEKVLDLLHQELPTTLKALRHTGSDLSDLADDVTEGIHSASRVVKQVDHSLSEVRQQAQTTHHVTRSLWVGTQVAWRVLTAQPRQRRRRPPTRRPPLRGSHAEPDTTLSVNLPPESGHPLPGQTSGQISETPMKASPSTDPQKKSAD